MATKTAAKPATPNPPAQPEWTNIQLPKGKAIIITGLFSQLKSWVDYVSPIAKLSAGSSICAHYTNTYLMDFADGGMSITATDGHILARDTHDVDVTSAATLIVDAAWMDKVIAFAAKTNKSSRDEYTIRVENGKPLLVIGENTYTIQTHDLKWPPVERVIRPEKPYVNKEGHPRFNPRLLAVLGGDDCKIVCRETHDGKSAPFRVDIDKMPFREAVIMPIREDA